MRRIASLGVAAVLALAAGCGKNDAPPTDGNAGVAPAFSIEGTYLLVGIEEGGNVETAEQLAKVPESARAFTIKANTITFTADGPDSPLAYTIDAAKMPHEIDLVERRPGEREEKSYGIVKLEGDTLTLCAVKSADPADRPKRFISTPENKATIMVLKKK